MRKARIDRYRFAVLLGAAVALLLTGVTQQAGARQGPTTGTLTQLSSPNGCITDASAPISGCGTARALLGPAPFFGSHSVAISPNGKNLYAVSFGSNGIAIFDRDRETGELTQKSGSAGCIVTGSTSGCGVGRALIKPTSVAVSPDGESVYVASIGDSSVTTFERNTSTGTLKQKSAGAGCITNTAHPGCATGRALDGADVVAVSPDGRNVYVGAFKGNGVAVFDRNSKGTLKQKSGPFGCIAETPTADCKSGRALSGAEGLTVSPDGKSVYVGAALSNAVAIFTRSKTTGRLEQPPAH